MARRSGGRNRDIADFAVPAGRNRWAGERRIVIAAVLALAALVVMVITGGPVGGARQLDPAVARLIEVERTKIRPLPRSDPSQPTKVRVRVPDRASELAGYFDAMNYRLKRVREAGGAVPRVFVANLPWDLDRTSAVTARKGLFIRIVLPQVLKANEAVAFERRRLLRWRGSLAAAKSLSVQDAAGFSTLLRRYRVAIEDPAAALEELVRRVDEVPPSLALAQAIQESGWGRSRFARKGNALFGQRSWDDDAPGLEPAEAGGFKVRSFADLGDSVESYIYNLNVGGAYARFREERAAMRARFDALDGYRLAGTLAPYSEEGPAYVGKLAKLIAHNGLQAFDRAYLRHQVIAQHVVLDRSAARIRVAFWPGAPED